MVDYASRTGCMEPIDLRDSIISESKMKCMWEGDAMMYEFEYRQLGTYGWTRYVRCGANGIILDSLSANIMYEYRIRSLCRDRGNLEWVYSTFQTHYEGAVCDAPTNINMRSMGGVRMLFSWDCDGIVRGWEYEVHENNIKIQNGFTTTKDILFDSIPLDVEFRIKLRSVCREGLYSEWGETEIFCLSTSGCSSPT